MYYSIYERKMRYYQHWPLDTISTRTTVNELVCNVSLHLSFIWELRILKLLKLKCEKFSKRFNILTQWGIFWDAQWLIWVISGSVSTSEWASYKKNFLNLYILFTIKALQRDNALSQTINFLDFERLQKVKL